jgi:hypothetical protein
LQSACRDSDHLQPDGHPRDAKLLVREDNFPGEWRADQRGSAITAFLFSLSNS